MIPIPYSFTTKTICISLSVVMAVIGYVPLFKRIRKRHHTRDFSKTFQWCYLLIQMNNGVLAYSEHAPFLFTWYALQTVFSAGVLTLVYKYWNHLPPPLPPSIK
jgi:hypothetical protein